MSRILNSPSFWQWMLRSVARLPIPKIQGLYSRLPPFRDNSERDFTVEFFGIKYTGNLSQYIDRHIFYFGSYSKQELFFLRAATSILRQSRKKITMIDVGANVGQHSLFMSNYADRILSFEPNETVANLFQGNIQRNQIQNIELYRCALGAEDGKGILGSGLDNNSGSRSLVWSLDPSQDLEVPLRSGDTVCENQGVEKVDILKIDVEGYEENVFIGMKKVLHRDRPVILFEIIGGRKGVFGSKSELQALIYPDAELFSLGGSSSPRLLPFDWSFEEAVCIPKELVAHFSEFIVSNINNSRT